MLNGLGIPPWLGAGALAATGIGIISSSWQKIKLIFWRIISLALCQEDLRDDQTSNAVLAYLIKNYQRSKIYDRTYGANYDYTRKDGKYGMIPYEFLGGKTLTFWNGWKPLFFGTTGQKSQTQNSQSNNNNYWGNNNSVQTTTKVLTFIRGTWNAEEIVKAACDARNDISWNTANTNSKQRRFFIRDVPNPVKDQQNGNLSFSVGTSIAWYQEGHYRLLKHNPWELGKAHVGSKKALDYLIFPDRVKKLIREIQIWRKNRDWYIERGVPWKRGWILYGPPGTGKTALVRAFAEDEDMPLFVFSLGELLNSELMRSWEEMQAHVPCVALFEDMDNVFHGRNNVAGSNLGFGKILGAMAPPPPPPQSPGGTPANQPQDNVPKLGMLSFDCLLNCIDGVKKSDGIFTIITTNDITKIDPALGQPRQLPDGTVEFISSRPGRIDKAIELTYMEHNDKLIMADRILDGYPQGLEQMVDFLKKYPDLQETPAQFQERCSQLALSYFWIEQASKEDLIGYDLTAEINKKALSPEIMEKPVIEKYIETTTVEERWKLPDQDEDFFTPQRDVTKIDLGVSYQKEAG